MRAPGVSPDGTFALHVSPGDYITSLNLTTSAQAIAVPSTLGACFAFFASEVNFTVAYGSSAGASTASFSSAGSSGCELNPTVRAFPKGSVAELSIIGHSTGYLSIAWYNSGST